MDKIAIPFLLLLALIGAGAAVWFYVAEDSIEPDDTKQPEVVDVDEEMATVDKKPDPSAVVGERIEIAKGSGEKAVAEIGPEGILQGTVYDLNGKPLAGTKIKLFKFKQVPMPKTGRTRIDFAQKEVKMATTDATGHYEFKECLAKYPGKQLSMKSLNREYVAVLKDHVGAGMVVDFKLQRGARVMGVITDRDTGKPIEGVRVKGDVKNVTSSMHSYERFTEVTKTDSQGRYELNGAPAGRLQMLLEHEDYEMSYIAPSQGLDTTLGNDLKFSFKMKRGIVLNGLVIDATTRKPIAGAVFTYKEMPFISHAKEKTGILGKFRVKGISRGFRSIEIMAKDYTHLRQNVDFNDDDMAKEIIFELKPAGRARGLVLDDNGDPVENADIYVAIQIGVFFKIRDYPETRTDAQGQFEVRNLGDGVEYKICAAREGWTVGVGEVLRGATGEVVEDVIVTVDRGSVVQGQILDQSGVAIAGAEVALYKPPVQGVWFPPGFKVGQKSDESVVADETGTYKFKGLHAGRYRLSVDHVEYIAVASKQVDISAGNESLNYDFNLERGRTISGRVVDDVGNVVAGARVDATQGRNIRQRVSATTDESGEYVIRRLHDRPYRIFASSRSKVGTALDDVPADSSNIDFVLQNYGSLRAHLASRSGETPEKMKITLFPLADVERKGAKYAKDRMAQKMMRTSEAFIEKDIYPENGYIDVQKIVPGDYRIELSSDEFREYKLELITIASGSLTNGPEIVLLSGGRLEGYILDSEGNPVGGKEIQIFLRAGRGTLKKTSIGKGGKRVTTSSRADWPGKQVVPDSEGFYSIGGLPPGKIEMVIRSRLYCVPQIEELQVPGESILKKNVTMVRGGTVLFHVKDENAAPVPHAQVSVVTMDGNPAKVDGRRVAARGSVRGELRVPKLMPGKYKFYIRRRGHDTVELEIEVGPGEQAIRDVTLPVIR
ncbi:MAG: carboxypeptidase regulatory-like domain-containing protein [Planctomycetota bacterium]